MSLISSGSWHSGHVEWGEGAPEVVLPITVAAEASAEFRLVRTDDNGSLETAGIGTLKGFAGTAPLSSQVKISPSGGGAARRGFTALLTASGDSGEIDAGSDVRGWEFDAQVDGEILCVDPGQSSYRIAHRRDSSGKIVGTLSLEVVVRRK